MDHVFPSSLYPASMAGSKVQRLTVPACDHCQRKWSDAEAHFRNVVAVAGPPNHAVQELWDGPIRRALAERDGERRRSALQAIMKPCTVDGQPRHRIYPAADERVLGVVRKSIRGLCFHHSLLSPADDAQVWANLLLFEVPPAFWEEMAYEHREADVVQYRYGMIQDGGMHSMWVLTFYERTRFVGVVWDSVEARRRAEEESQRA